MVTKTPAPGKKLRKKVKVHYTRDKGGHTDRAYLIIKKKKTNSFATPLDFRM